MNPETQILVERIEALERHGRGANALAGFATLVAVVALALPFMRSAPVSRAPSTPDRTRSSVVEANRFLLRDRDGQVAGGMEVDANGTIKLVLGRGQEGGAVFLEAQKNGVSHLTLRGPGGKVRAMLLGGELPSLALTTREAFSAVTLTAGADGAGRIVATDARGRTRFHAP